MSIHKKQSSEGNLSRDGGRRELAQKGLCRNLAAGKGIMKSSPAIYSPPSQMLFHNLQLTWKLQSETSGGYQVGRVKDDEMYIFREYLVGEN